MSTTLLPSAYRNVQLCSSTATRSTASLGRKRCGRREEASAARSPAGTRLGPLGARAQVPRLQLHEAGGAALAVRVLKLEHLQQAPLLVLDHRSCEALGSARRGKADVDTDQSAARCSAPSRRAARRRVGAKPRRRLLWPHASDKAWLGQAVTSGAVRREVSAARACLLLPECATSHRVQNTTPVLADGGATGNLCREATGARKRARQTRVIRLKTARASERPLTESQRIRE